MSIKQALQFITTIMLATAVSVASAQVRPVPESAPVIVLPEPVVEDEVVQDEEGTTDSQINPELIDIPEPSFVETEVVEMITGTGTPKTQRWPLQREIKGGLVILAFDDVTIEETLGFIAQTTGKVVIPVNATSLKSKKITLRNDEPVDRGVALDLLFQAFRLNQVGVIERDDIIIIGPLDTMLNDIGDIPVLGVDEDVMNRQDRGTLVIKVFSVEKTEANVIGENIGEMFPDYGLLTVYPESNQIVLLGDIGLCQQIQQLIDQLDRIWRSGKLRTFRLKYADASEISTNIIDLFEESGTTSSARTTQNRNTRARTTPSSSGSSEQVELRLTVNMQQNSVTVQAEPDVMKDIEELIVTEWDLPRPTETSKMYILKYSDPIKIRNMLQEILGDGSSSGGPTRAGQNQRADVTQAISGVYRFEAYPDKNALLVLSKTEESFDFLDSIIDSLDQKSDVGLPVVIELKHANAVALAEELNALLAAPGVSATIPRPDTGLSGEGFSEEGDATASSESGGQMSFPWQQGGANNDDQSPESSLISKIRIVPIVRQNAITVLAPPAYLQSILDVIEEFDRPTRQVMISATIAAVTLSDDLELGLRWGSNIAASGDNSLGLNGNLTGTIDFILGGLFEDNGAIFTLGEANNVGVVIDALNQLTNVRIIQQPRTFTSDNQESVFFNGSEVPIRTTTTTLSSGDLQAGIEYRDVGVMLNVRPRITGHGNIDLSINVELSEQSGASADVDNNPIFSRRQVRSQVQLMDGQTVLIGGILKESESNQKRKVPLLGDIPIIGALFSSVDNTTIREELLVFITPIIVDDLDDNDSNFNVEYLERLKKISLPVDEFIENLEDGDDFLIQRLRNPGSDYNRLN